MRLYICTDGSYAGTQADAKAKGKGFSLANVPTDKDGLLDYLNGLARETSPPEPLGASPATAAPVPAIRQPDAGASFTAAEIEAFILDRATVAQVGHIFEALGTRFAEARSRR